MFEIKQFQLPIMSVDQNGIYNLEQDEFPVNRIFCVGKNYSDHVREMGGTPEANPPVFFTKDRSNLHQGGPMPFPPATSNLHFEGELVVALHKGGHDITLENAKDHVFGFACGCDLTRRDLQAECKEKRAPWDVAKSFENAAVCGPILKAPLANVDNLSIHTLKNGEVQQFGTTRQMIYAIPEIIMHLSKLFTLRAGDLIYTGTPAGVGPMVKGDTIEVTIETLVPVSFTLT